MKNIILQIAGVIFLVFLPAGFSSCSKEINNEEREQELIANYLDANDIDVEPTESGLYYVELIEGNGVQPVAGDTVEIFYIGYFLDGRIFDNNINSSPLRFALGSSAVIEGMDEGVLYMKEGGQALLVMPSSLAYGPFGSYPIPGYTPLAFEVLLDKVIPGP